MESDRLNEELRHLKERLDRGEIDEADYEKERQRLLGSAGHARPVDPFAATEGDSYHPRRPTQLADLAPDMEIGPQDNRFRLVREIGGGAMGQIWLANDLAEEELEGGERFKALKVVNPLLQDSPRALEMLKREAMQASRLNHPNIINVYGWRQGRDGWLFVVMDYLEGRDLDRVLLDEGTPGLSWKRTLELLKLVAAGLDYAHDQNIIHRDLKPGNVFITKEGKVKLLDFGLAYRLHRSSSMVKVQESSSSGTPEYMPPEAFAAGMPEKAQDIYALACISYEMLTCKLPYSREAAVRRSPDLMPGKPEALAEAAWEVLKSGLAYRKEYRPDSAGELVRQLEEPPPLPPPSLSTKRWLVGSIVIMFLVVGLSYVVLVPNNFQEEAVKTEQTNKRDEEAAEDDQSVEGSETISLQESNDQSPEVLAEPEKSKVSKQPAPKPEEPPLQNIHGRPAKDVRTLQEETVKTDQAIEHEEEAAGDDQSVERSETISLQESNGQSPKAPVELEVDRVSGETAIKPEQPPLQNIHRWPVEKVRVLQQQAAAALDKPVEFQDSLKDGSPGPDMVVIPRGGFLMGSPKDETGRDGDEKHGHNPVWIKQSFALGQHEVTVEEFRRFVEANGHRTETEKGDGCYYWGGKEWKKDAKRTWRNPGFEQDDKHPVVCVSWKDAMAYVEWLSGQTGQPYRLPTEAEWEYATRAGTPTARYWGDEPDHGCDYANAADRTLKQQLGWALVMECSDHYVYTAPAGRYLVNNFGLSNVLGNVWEWTCSGYNKSYGGAEQECISKDHVNNFGFSDVLGKVWEWICSVFDENCGGAEREYASKDHSGLRVVRGGSWNNIPRFVRSANRYKDAPGNRGSNLGFRLARSF